MPQLEPTPVVPRRPVLSPARIRELRRQGVRAELIQTVLASAP